MITKRATFHSRKDGRLDLRGLLLVVLTGGWLIGILLAADLTLPQIAPPLVAILALSVICIFWHHPVARLAGLVLLCLGLGAWRYAIVTPAGDPHAIRAWIGAGKVEVQASVGDEPRLESNTTLLTVTVQRVSLDQGRSWQEADGQLQIQTLGASFDSPYAPRYGDTLRLTGRLTAPPSSTIPEIQASMAFPAIVIAGQGGNFLLVALYQARTALAGILMQALPQPFAALLIAIFLSLRTPSLKPLLPLFSETGTVHLIAPSGFKITLLSSLVGGSTGWLVPRRDARDQPLLPAQKRRGNRRLWLRTLLVVCCIILYTFLSGGGPAAIRAGIMGTLLALAPRLERFYNVYTSLALAALLMTLVDPFVLWDTGFQLSFLGTLGIVSLTPFLRHPLRFLARLPLGYHLGEIVAVTFAAEIATLPIFALSFSQISLVAALANIVSVPFLSVLLVLGALICLSGLLSLQLALLCGWVAWPLLWYIITTITWCAHLPGASFPVENLNPLLAWEYYALLAWIYTLLIRRWPPVLVNAHALAAPLLPRKVKRALFCGFPLATLLLTGVLAQVNQTGRFLTINVLTTGDPAQGEALYLRTPGGQTALIDEGADSTTLARTLDSFLPFWQRSLSLVVLTDTSSSNLAGLQDVIERYTVEQAVDAGMLHPSAAYARWRDALLERGITYTQVRQGMSVTLGQQVAFQVLWPPAQLYKGGDEMRENALILRLLAPELRLLLLNSTALSVHALNTLAESVNSTYLQAQIVQFSGESGKTFAATLAPLLTLVRPSLLIITSLPATKKKQSKAAIVPPAGPWQAFDARQTSGLTLRADGQGWSVDTT